MRWRNSCISYLSLCCRRHSFWRATSEVLDPCLHPRLTHRHPHPQVNVLPSQTVLLVSLVEDCEDLVFQNILELNLASKEIKVTSLFINKITRSENSLRNDYICSLTSLQTFSTASLQLGEAWMRLSFSRVSVR